jgi:purine catabolism regulator
MAINDRMMISTDLTSMERGGTKMNLKHALTLESFSRARVVAGADSLEQTIRWIQVVDLPDPLPWVNAGDFILTTGQAWPRESSAQRTLIKGLAERGVAGVGFAVPNFFKNIPAAACEAAEEVQLPLFEIPWDIAFSSITKEVHSAIISVNYELLEKSEIIHRELMKSAVEADSLQDIAAMLGRVIERDLFVEHPEGRQLASYLHSGKKGKQGSLIDSNWMKLIDKEIPFVMKSMGRGTGPLRLPADDQGEGLPARSVWPIHVKSELVAFLWIMEKESPISDLEIRAAEYATLVMALHISGQRQLVAQEAQLGLSFLESLQEGSFQPTLQSLKRSEVLGFDIEGAYKMALLALTLPVPLSKDGILKRERITERLRQKMRKLDIPPLLSFAQNQITFLLPEHVDTRALWHSFKAEQGILFAVSRAHKGFAGVQKAFQEVTSMLPHLTVGDYYDYEDLLVPRLLMGEQDARELFLLKMLKPIRQSRNGEVLVQTLLEAARNGFQLKKTAEIMCVHPKTLRYRLDKASEIGGLALDDKDTQFNLQLAARIMHLMQK